MKQPYKLCVGFPVYLRVGYIFIVAQVCLLLVSIIAKNSAGKHPFLAFLFFVCKQTGPITIHCAAKLSMQCNNMPALIFR